LVKNHSIETRAHSRAQPLCHGEDIDEENVVPKCGKTITGKYFTAVDTFRQKDHEYHLANQNRTRKSPTYCPETTARVLPTMMGKKAIPTRLLRSLKVGETHEIGRKFHITLLYAIHCLESAMFLFEGASTPGDSVLSTGVTAPTKDYFVVSKATLLSRSSKIPKSPSSTSTTLIGITSMHHS
uniref:C2H2-type domain-containing protein n=1 Tax=Angiostrongylus cantonensis TaxID=6313 RepID=A0A0K0DKP4_ANGCA